MTVGSAKDWYGVLFWVLRKTALFLVCATEEECMPLRDGTGPFGFGPAWGRGRVGCRGYRTGGVLNGLFRRKNGWFMGVTAPLLAIVVRDLLNPQGFFGKALKSAVSRQLNAGTGKSVKKAEYIIVEEMARSESLKKKKM